MEHVLPRFFCYYFFLSNMIFSSQSGCFITQIKWDVIIFYRWDYCWKCKFDTDVKIERRLSGLRALPINDTLLTSLCTYAPYVLLNTCLRAYGPYTPQPSSKGALSAFVLSCDVLLQLKGKLCFVCSLQLTSHHPSLSFLLFYHIKLFAFFLSFILNHWLHHYLYNQIT